LTADEELRRAGEARQMIEQRIFQEARKSIESQLEQARRSVPIRDVDMHTRLILMEQLWHNFVGYFEQIAQTGKLAELEIAERQRREKTFIENILSFRTGGRNSV